MRVGAAGLGGRGLDRRPPGGHGAGAAGRARSPRVLRGGGVVGIFPEGARGAGDFERFHRGAAYLAMVSGAPVVPVVQIGTREPGADMGSLPPRGAVVDVVVGAPYRLEQTPWPRTREQVADASLLIREHMLALIDEARVLTGRELPGPMPPGELDDDPYTGLILRGEP